MKLIVVAVLATCLASPAPPDPDHEALATRPESLQMRHRQDTAENSPVIIARAVISVPISASVAASLAAHRAAAARANTSQSAAPQAQNPDGQAMSGSPCQDTQNKRLRASIETLPTSPTGATRAANESQHTLPTSSASAASPAINLTSSTSASTSTSTTSTSTSASQAEQQWSCSACTLLNHGALWECEICGATRTHAS